MKVAEKYQHYWSKDDPIEKCQKSSDTNDCLILKDNFENVTISKQLLEDSRQFITPAFLTDFSLDFTKCPVTVCLLIAPFENKVESVTYEKFSKTFLTKNENSWLLIDISKVALEEEGLENWQHLWSLKKCLEPQFYSHDLVN